MAIYSTIDKEVKENIIRELRAVVSSVKMLEGVDEAVRTVCLKRLEYALEKLEE